MILREEWSSNLYQWRHERWDPNWRPKPGDFCSDVADKMGTFGLIIAVGVLQPGGSERALVLWTRCLSSKARLEQAFVRNMAKQIADEENNEIMKILTEMNNS